MGRGPGWRAVSIDELEEMPWRGEGPTWRPLRAALETRIAGVSAYTAASAGETVIGAHVESTDGRGHEVVGVPDGSDYTYVAKLTS